MNPQTRKLIMWNEHAERWAPIGAAACEPPKPAPAPTKKIGFIFTSNLPTKTTTVQVDASAYTEETERTKNENHITANRKR